MKNEEEENENFSNLPKNISIYIILKLRTTLISNMYSDFSYLSTIKSYSPPKYAKMAKNGQKQAKWTHFEGL